MNSGEINHVTSSKTQDQELRILDGYWCPTDYSKKPKNNDRREKLGDLQGTPAASIARYEKSTGKRQIHSGLLEGISKHAIDVCEPDNWDYRFPEDCAEAHLDRVLAVRLLIDQEHPHASEKNRSTYLIDQRNKQGQGAMHDLAIVESIPGMKAFRSRLYNGAGIPRIMLPAEDEGAQFTSPIPEEYNAAAGVWLEALISDTKSIGHWSHLVTFHEKKKFLDNSEGKRLTQAMLRVDAWWHQNDKRSGPPACVSQDYDPFIIVDHRHKPKKDAKPDAQGNFKPSDTDETETEEINPKRAIPLVGVFYYSKKKPRPYLRGTKAAANAMEDNAYAGDLEIDNPVRPVVWLNPDLIRVPTPEGCPPKPLPPGTPDGAPPPPGEPGSPDSPTPLPPGTIGNPPEGGDTFPTTSPLPGTFPTSRFPGGDITPNPFGEPFVNPFGDNPFGEPTGPTIPPGPITPFGAEEIDKTLGAYMQGVQMGPDFTEIPAGSWGIAKLSTATVFLLNSVVCWQNNVITRRDEQINTPLLDRDDDEAVPVAFDISERPSHAELANTVSSFEPTAQGLDADTEAIQGDVICVISEGSYGFAFSGGTGEGPYENCAGFARGPIAESDSPDLNSVEGELYPVNFDGDLNSTLVGLRVSISETTKGKATIPTIAAPLLGTWTWTILGTLEAIDDEDTSIGYVRYHYYQIVLSSGGLGDIGDLGDIV